MNPPLRLMSECQEVLGRIPEHVVGVEGRDMWLAGDLTDTHRFILHLPDLHMHLTFNARSARVHQSAFGRPLPRWARAITGVTCALIDARLTMNGAICLALGDEPQGVRYEFALGMAWASLWLQVNDYATSTDLLLELMDTVQKKYPGVYGLPI